VDGGLYQIRMSQNDMYDIPNRRLLEHRVAGRGYLKIGPLRAPLDPPYFFAQEGMMDELAHLAGLDPYEFRKRNISHARWLGVLKAAADAAKWTPRVAGSTVTGARIASGRGIALGTHHLIPNQGDRVTYAAAVVDVEVNKDTGVVIAKQVWRGYGLAVIRESSDCRHVRARHESGARESEIQPDERDEPRLEYVSALRFGEHPAVTPVVVQRIGESTGAGESAAGWSPSERVLRATGVRLRHSATHRGCWQRSSPPSRTLKNCHHPCPPFLRGGEFLCRAGLQDEERSRDRLRQQR
jgi:hypothetical protein